MAPDHDFETVPVRVTEPKGSDSYPLHGNFLLINTSALSYEVDYNSQFSIKFVSEGSKLYEVNSKQYLLNPNNYIIVNNGSRVKSRNSSPGASFSVFLSQQLISEVGRQMIGNPDFDPAPESSFQADLSLRSIRYPVLDYLRQSSQYFMNPSSEVDPGFYYQMAELLLQSHSDTRWRIEAIDKNKLATRQEIYKRVHRAIEFINDNSSKKFSLDEVAREACMSKYYLIKYFHLIVGVTPNEFHIHRRIKLALGFMKDEEKSLSEVAAQCGYPDIQSFSKQFRKLMGSSPSVFRRLNFERTRP